MILYKMFHKKLKRKCGFTSPIMISPYFVVFRACIYAKCTTFPSGNNAVCEITGTMHLIQNLCRKMENAKSSNWVI